MPSKCADCQKNIPKRPFTTYVEALYCNACNKAHDEKFKREGKNLDRALQLFPELLGPSILEVGYSEAKSMLRGPRPDIQMMQEESKYVVFLDCDKEGTPRIVVFDAESETIAKEVVKPDPKAKYRFDMEISAMNACIQKLTQQGTIPSNRKIVE